MITNLNKAQEFIKALEKEIKRLSPTLTLNMNSLDPYAQVIYIIKIAVDTLIEERKSLESDYIKLSHDSYLMSTSSEQNEFRLAKSKLLDAQNQLKKFERLVRQKEKKIEEKEKELNALSISFRKSEPLACKDLRSSRDKDTEFKASSFTVREDAIKEDREKLEKDKKLFEGEKLALLALKGKIQKNQEEIEKLAEKTRAEYENAQKDRETLQFELRILEQKINATDLKQEYIENLMKDLEQKKKLLEDQKSQRKADINSEAKLETLEKNIESKFKLLSNKKTPSQAPDAAKTQKDLDGLFVRLQEQIEIYNSEVEIREQLIIEKHKKVAEEEMRLKERFERVVEIERYLMGVRNEIKEFRASILEEFEGLFRRAKVQQEMFEKKMVELEKIQRKVADSIFLKG